MRMMHLALLGTALFAAVPALVQPAMAQPVPPAPADTKAAPAPGAQATPMGRERGPGAPGPRAMFALVDVNRDGRVSMEETWTFVQARFGDADRNKDGSLVLEEALALPMMPRPKDAPGTARAEPGNPMQARMVAMMFRVIDANRDGKVTPEEVRPAVEARFRGLDANGDNGVTLDELPAPHQHGVRHGDHGPGPHGMRGPGGPDAPPPAPLPAPPPPR